MSNGGRDVFLWGPMGGGKSTVGARLAIALGAVFLDTDALVEQRLGRTIAASFAALGEAGFRRAERDVVEHILEGAAAERRVVALGGGALLDRALRLSALERGSLVVLTATSETCAARVNVSRETRPLLSTGGAGDTVATLERLVSERANAYAECHRTIDTTGRDVEAVVAEVIAALGRPLVSVAAGRQSYGVDVHPSVNALDGLFPFLTATSSHLITDTNVAALPSFEELRIRAEARGACAPVILAAGEQHKTLEGMQPMWQALLAANADRSAMLVGVGGGVVTDMTGFAAATWHRGVRWIAVPTTLLGMVDASVGGKTGVDLGPAKNALGAFHPPLAVHTAIGWLRTEPERSYRSGLAELVKTALLARPALFETMVRNPEPYRAERRDEHVLYDAVLAATSAKAAIVSRDPEERGERAVLNLGHTLGHALESAGSYARYTHGEAVGLGLLAALRVGTSLGITQDGAALVKTTEQLLANVGLPTALPSATLEEALPLLGLDKKKKGRDVRFITIERPGRPKTVDLPLEELRALLRRAHLGPV